LETCVLARGAVQYTPVLQNRW